MAAKCEKCDARVFWAKFEKTGKPTLIDQEPVDGGNIELVDGKARVVPSIAGVRRYRSHFATCAAGDLFRKPR